MSSLRTGGDLLSLLHEGALDCVRRLNKISKARWGIAALATGDEADRFCESLIEDIATDYYGTAFSLPGAGALVIFPRTSGIWLTHNAEAFAAGAADILDKRESVVLAEMSNILVNAMLPVLPEAFDRLLIPSAPKKMIDNGRALLERELKGLKPEDIALTSYVRFLANSPPLDCVVLLFLGKNFLKGI